MLSRNLIKMVNIITIDYRLQCSVPMFSVDTKLSLLIDHRQLQHLQTIRRGSIDAVTDLEGEPILTQLQGGSAP